MNLRTFFLIVIYIAVAVAGLKAYAGTTLEAALRSTTSLRIGNPLEHSGSRRDQGSKASYVANANVGEYGVGAGPQCHFGFGYRVEGKQVDALFVDATGVVPTKSLKWEGIRELPWMKPFYFQQNLYLNPKAELTVQEVRQPTQMPIYACLESKTEYRYDDYWETKCVRYADKPSHYFYSIHWKMKSVSGLDVTYEGSCRKYNQTEAGAVITLEEFQTVTGRAFLF